MSAPRPTKEVSGKPDPLYRGIEIVLGTVASLLLFGLMALTCVDVVGRYFLDRPVVGAFEVTEILVVALVFAALPLTTLRGEHVEVDLLAMTAGPRLNRLMLLFSACFSAALLATFAWRLAVYAEKSAHDGAVTNALGIPLAPFGYFAAFACLLSAAILVRQIFRMRRPEGAP